MILKVKKLFADAQLPVRSNPTDSGADVFVYRFERLFTAVLDVVPYEALKRSPSIILLKNDRVLVHTGITVTVGSGYEIQVRPRSGNALKKGLIVVNSPGTIDESYRGMLGIIIANIGHEPQEIKVGDKIAQIIVSAVEYPTIVEVESLDDTERGSEGFGSTGN